MVLLLTVRFLKWQMGPLLGLDVRPNYTGAGPTVLGARTLILQRSIYSEAPDNQVRANP